jgi:hypothetical protein
MGVYIHTNTAEAFKIKITIPWTRSILFVGIRENIGCTLKTHPKKISETKKITKNTKPFDEHHSMSATFCCLKVPWRARVAQSVQWLGYGLNDPGFESRLGWHNVQADSGTHLGFYSIVRGVKLTTQIHLVSRLKMSGANTPTAPIRLHGTDRDNFLSILRTELTRRKSVEQKIAKRKRPNFRPSYVSYFQLL